MPLAFGPDEFADALASNGRALWVIASAWVGRGDADDIVQEAARIAWQKRREFVRGNDAGPWLATIVRQVGANWRRKLRPEIRAQQDLPEPVVEAIASADWPFDVDRAGLSDEMARALAQLPEVGRACLLLHVVIGLTFAEIATLLGVPENTAMSHARRARTALRAALADPGEPTAPRRTARGTIPGQP